MRRLIFILLALLVINSYAGQFRAFKPIAAPAHKPENAAVVKNPAPVERAAVEKAVDDLLGAWNQESSENLLDKDFYDASRFSDVMDEKVPRDARLRLLSVQGSQTLEQYEMVEDGRAIRSSIVSVTANTQMEFNDPETGFRKLNGQNEYILRIDEELVEAQP